MLDLREIMNRPQTSHSVAGFVEDLETGISQDRFPVRPASWRVSQFVHHWAKKLKDKETYLYKKLVTGTVEDDFDVETLKRFNIGHKVHDLVKDYFEKSPHFRVIHNELGIAHPDFPLRGTMDHVIEWDKHPNQEFVVEIKSCQSEFMYTYPYGAKFQPFKKNRWQAGIYSEIYGAPAIVLYYDKNESHMIAHLLKREDYVDEVNEMFETCRRAWARYQAEGPKKVEEIKVEGEEEGEIDWNGAY